MYRLQNKLRRDENYGNELVTEKKKKERIQMTRHKARILKAAAETRKSPMSEPTGCVVKLAQIMVFNSAPLIRGDGAG